MVNRWTYLVTGSRTRMRQGPLLRRLPVTWTAVYARTTSTNARHARCVGFLIPRNGIDASVGVVANWDSTRPLANFLTDALVTLALGVVLWAALAANPGVVAPDGVWVAVVVVAMVAELVVWRWRGSDQTFSRRLTAWARRDRRHAFVLSIALLVLVAHFVLGW